jgi:hypothetical protein
MQVTKELFGNILSELIEDNPLACRTLLRIADLEFGDTVATLAMSLGDERPTMHVNLDFLSKHCLTEFHVKALIMHEFLHVLLNHTEKFKKMTPELNLALDAVINAIIHRMMGPEYSDMMSRYYSEARGLMKLLRPQTDEEIDKADSSSADLPLYKLWQRLYEGRLVADDLIEIAETLGGKKIPMRIAGEDAFLGNHSPQEGDARKISDTVKKALEVTIKSTTGKGIWRAPDSRGVGKGGKIERVWLKEAQLQLWEREAMAALKRCVTPDRRSANMEMTEASMSFPVLNTRDKRGFIRSMGSPILPDIIWTTEKPKPIGTTQIYLDVSGSMSSEMDALVALLGRLRKSIRLPFWAFSDVVAPATIKNGKLVTSTTGGTSIDAVLQHIAATKPKKAVIVTDGLISQCNDRLLAATRDQKLFAIISHNGNSSEIERAGIPYIQLPRFKK